MSNEKIAAALTVAVSAGSVVLFAAARKKNRTRKPHLQTPATIKTVITLANTLTA